MFVVLYVDDLLIGCADPSEADEIAQKLEQNFTLKSLEDARCVLGIEVEYKRVDRVLKMKQQHFIYQLLERFSSLTRAAFATPLFSVKNSRRPPNTSSSVINARIES